MTLDFGGFGVECIWFCKFSVGAPYAKRYVYGASVFLKRESISSGR